MNATMAAELAAKKAAREAKLAAQQQAAPAESAPLPPRPTPPAPVVAPEPVVAPTPPAVPLPRQLPSRPVLPPPPVVQQEREKEEENNNKNNNDDDTGMDTELYGKYMKMRNMNLPDGAIRQKMMTDGVLSSMQMEAFFNGGNSSPLPASPPPPRPSPPAVVVMPPPVPAPVVVAPPPAPVVVAPPPAPVVVAPPPAPAPAPATLAPLKVPIFDNSGSGSRSLEQSKEGVLATKITSSSPSVSASTSAHVTPTAPLSPQTRMQSSNGKLSSSTSKPTTTSSSVFKVDEDTPVQGARKAYVPTASVSYAKVSEAIFAKFENMYNNNVSEGDIRRVMKNEGFGFIEINRFFDNMNPPTTPIPVYIPPTRPIKTAVNNNSPGSPLKGSPTSPSMMINSSDANRPMSMNYGSPKSGKGKVMTVAEKAKAEEDAKRHESMKLHHYSAMGSNMVRYSSVAVALNSDANQIQDSANKRVQSLRLSPAELSQVQSSNENKPAKRFSLNMLGGSGIGVSNNNGNGNGNNSGNPSRKSSTVTNEEEETNYSNVGLGKSGSERGSQTPPATSPVVAASTPLVASDSKRSSGLGKILGWGKA